MLTHHSRILLCTLLVGTGLLASQALHAEIVDVALGAKRAAVCFACHGENGVALTPGTPHLAGQNRRYLESALNDYRSGQRLNPTMAAMAKPLSDQDIANIAAYFELSKSVPPSLTLSDLLDQQQRLAPIGAVSVGSTASPKNATVAVSTKPSPQTSANQGERSIATIYQSHCAACHTTGAAGAPKLDDRQAWSVRAKQGDVLLLKHAISGLNAMPPRGTCSDCSDTELAAIIAAMVAGKPL